MRRGSLLLALFLAGAFFAPRLAAAGDLQWAARSHGGSSPPHQSWPGGGSSGHHIGSPRGHESSHHDWHGRSHRFEHGSRFAFRSKRHGFSFGLHASESGSSFGAAGPPPWGAAGPPPFAAGRGPVVLISTPFFCHPHGTGFTDESEFVRHLHEQHGLPERRALASCREVGGKLFFFGF